MLLDHLELGILSRTEQDRLPENLYFSLFHQNILYFILLSIYIT